MVRTILFYIGLALVGFAIGLAVAFALDGFKWAGLRDNFGTGVGAMVGGLVGHYFSTRKKT